MSNGPGSIQLHKIFYWTVLGNIIIKKAIDFRAPFTPYIGMALEILYRIIGQV